MNTPNYTLAMIEGRVAAMEEECANVIADEGQLTMTATVIPEFRWLIDQIKAARSKLKAKAGPIEPAIVKIDDETAKMERKFVNSISVGKFIRVEAALIPKMRTLVDQLRADRKRARIAEVEEFEEAVA